MSVHEWLSLPSGISLTSHNSFTIDLLSQFEKKRRQILYDKEDVIFINTKSTNSSSHVDPSSAIQSKRAIHPVLNDENRNDSTSTNASFVDTNPQGNRQRSAGNLIRKSSLYLRNKLSHKTKHLFHSCKKQQKDTRQKPALLPDLLYPPTIQYPPKPLKYLPVEPLPEDTKTFLKLTRHKVGNKIKIFCCCSRVKFFYGFNK